MISARLGGPALALALASVLSVTSVAPAAFAQAAPAPAPVPAQAPPTPAPAESSPAPSTQPAPAEIDRETPEQRESRQLGRAWGWLFTSIGASSAAIAVGTSILMVQDANNRSSNCNAAKVCSPAGITANGQLGDLAGWNTATWLIAAAGLGVGITLLVTHPSDASKGMELEVRPTTTGASLGLRSAF